MIKHRKVSLNQLNFYLHIARNIYKDYGKIGNRGLNKLLDEINEREINKDDIMKLLIFYNSFDIKNLDEFIYLLEDEIEKRNL